MYLYTHTHSLSRDDCCYCFSFCHVFSFAFIPYQQQRQYQCIIVVIFRILVLLAGVHATWHIVGRGAYFQENGFCFRIFIFPVFICHHFSFVLPVHTISSYIYANRNEKKQNQMLFYATKKQNFDILSLCIHLIIW